MPLVSGEIHTRKQTVNFCGTSRTIVAMNVVLETTKQSERGLTGRIRSVHLTLRCTFSEEAKAGSAIA